MTPSLPDTLLNSVPGLIISIIAVPTAIYWFFFPFVVMTRMKRVTKQLEDLNTEQAVSNASMLKALKAIESKGDRDGHE